MKNLSNIIEAILFVAGNEVSKDVLMDKLSVTKAELQEAIDELSAKHVGDCGINLLQFNDKLQLASNPEYYDMVIGVLNPIREKELTQAMLETLSIIAYKQPITRLEIEEIRGVDCTYSIQTLSKLSMIKILGRKDTIGKPLLYGTTDEFLKRFSLTSIKALPDYSSLLDKIEILSMPNTDLYNSNRDMEFKPEQTVPEFLEGEKFDFIDEDTSNEEKK